MRDNGALKQTFGFPSMTEQRLNGIPVKARNILLLSRICYYLKNKITDTRGGKLYFYYIFIRSESFFSIRARGKPIFGYFGVLAFSMNILFVILLTLFNLLSYIQPRF